MMVPPYSNRSGASTTGDVVDSVHPAPGSTIQACVIHAGCHGDGHTQPPSLARDQGPGAGVPGCVDAG